MSILSSYIKLIPLAIKNREEIVEAVLTKAKRTLHKLPPEEQDEIIKRKLICATCPYNSKNAKEDGYVTDRVDDHCIHCSCNIDFKTECLSCRCGVEVWNKNNPKDKLELRWKSFKKPTDEQR